MVTKGSECTVMLEDCEAGTLFARCPLDNDKPEVSVEPVTDSSRYFVLRVVDSTGRHAFLGMGFNERSDAFDFNITLQDHVKQLRNGIASEAAAAAPPLPPQDFTLKGNLSISVGQSAKPRAAPRALVSTAPAGGLGGFLLPPPSGTGGGKRAKAKKEVRHGTAGATFFFTQLSTW